MKKISIGGFNLYADEIIKVTCEKASHTKWLLNIGSMLMLVSIIGIIQTLWNQKNVVELLFTFLVFGAFSFFMIYLADKKLYDYEITVITMHGGKIETHKKTFNISEDFNAIYKELKSYVK